MLLRAPNRLARWFPWYIQVTLLRKWMLCAGRLPLRSFYARLGPVSLQII